MNGMDGLGLGKGGEQFRGKVFEERNGGMVCFETTCS